MRFILLIGLIVLGSISGASQTDEKLKISLLTCSSGGPVYTVFGHSAIRVQHTYYEGTTLIDQDIVYDYGIFDFSTPNFVWKFINGDLQYRLSQKTFKTFKGIYIREERGMFEEELNLPLEEKKQILEVLRENYKPENRHYLYDFMMDNCSTRIRDLFLSGSATSDKHGSMTAMTFRENLHRYMENRQWLKFGIDFLIGVNGDQEMDFEDQMFLPDKLSENLHAYEANEPLLSDAETILPETESPADFLIGPFLLFGLLLLLAIVLVVKFQKLLFILSPYFLFVVGLFGVLILIVMFTSRHDALHYNMNVLWANPLFILIPLFRRMKFYQIIVKVLMGCLAVYLLIYVFGIQSMHIAIITIIPSIFILLLAELKRLELKSKL